MHEFIEKNEKYIAMGLFLLASMFLVSDANAQIVAGIDKMFANSAATWVSLAKLMKVLANLMGFFLVVVAIFKFAQMASDPRIGVKVPITTFFIGIALYSLSNSLSVTLETMALGSGPGEIFKGAGGGGSLSQMTADGIYGVLLFVRFIGYVAFIRGWLILNAYANGAQGAGLAKGITHILGGAAAINVQVTAGVLANTFAPGVTIPGITN